MEYWKHIKNYEKSYMVSSHGRVKSLLSNKMLKIATTNRGRGRVGFLGKNFEVHRLVAEQFLPKPLGKVEVNHKDGNPLNNNMDNLEWCTREENMRHAVKNGLRARGEKNGSSKLTKKQVEQIRKDYIYLDNGVKLANKYGVSHKLIYDIVKGKIWKY